MKNASGKTSNGMKLLIVTQAVDENDPILGFFCQWLSEFAKHATRITVIANSVGEYELPSNVEVHSLGKERGGSRLSRTIEFIGLLFSLRKEYDTILVHMTPEHAVLAVPIAGLMGKRLYLWYNHPERGVFLQLALPFVTKVFYTSPESASASASRSERMPVGIDADVFTPAGGTRDPSLIYMQGRISPSKRIDVALGALRILHERGIRAHLRVVGPVAEGYGVRLRTEFKDLFESGAVEFGASLPNRLTPAEYRNAAVSLNLAREGHFDKSALEAMACETPVIVGSRTFRGLVPDSWIIEEPDAIALANRLESFFKLSESERHDIGVRLCEKVASEHGLSALAERLFASMSESVRSMDPKRFYDSVSPKKFGDDYERARWGSSAIARAQYAMTADAIRRFALPGLSRARSVLELGPGPGTWTKILMEQNPDALYTLVDISKTMLDQARAALPVPNVSFVLCDWLAFRAEKPFDYFFSSRAIEYVADKAEAARVVVRSLAHGGSGLIVTKMPKPFFDAMRGRGTALHQGQISPALLVRFLSEAGLRVTGTTIVTATLPLFGSASLNVGMYALLKRLPLVFPFTLLAESYAVRFEKP